MKWTKGPWRIGNGDIYADGDASSDFDDRVICAIGRGGMRSHEYAIIPAHKPEGRANARLIAAAPDLYEALVIARRYVADLPIVGDADLAVIDAALTRATGDA